MDHNQEQQQGKPAQGAPATTYATNVRVPYSKLFNYGLTNDANGDLVIDDPNDKDLYPDQVNLVEEPVVAAPADPPPPQQAESISGDQLSDWYPILAPGHYGQASDSQLVYNWDNYKIEEVVEIEIDDQPREEDVEVEEYQEPQVDSKNLIGDDEKGCEDVLGPISTEDLEDFDDYANFIDMMYYGALEEDGEVAPEDDGEVAPEANENEEELDKEEEEDEELEAVEKKEEEAETAKKMEELKKKAEEEKMNQKLIEQLLKQDQFENRMRTLRNRGRLEKPKKKMTADEKKDQEELRKKAQGQKMQEFDEGISNDPNSPEIDEILRGMGMTLPRARPEERRRRRYESESDNENYDPEESRRARRKQQAKRRKHNN